MPEALFPSSQPTAEHDLPSDSGIKLRPGSMKTLPEANVVFLVNFVAPNLLEVFRELGLRFGSFTVVCSVPIEGNRQWKTETDGVDVRIQKTWTITRTARHPSGYAEPNYIHIPLDSWSQLRRLNPNVIVSLELGARTAFSSIYRLFHPSVVHVAAVLASERSEAGRGAMRRFMRRTLLKRVDAATYNGPSCKRYLESLGADAERLAAWDYAADPRKAFRGPINHSPSQPNHLSLLTVGQLSERKGVMQAVSSLNQFAQSISNINLSWTLVGDGPLRRELEQTQLAENLSIRFAGHCDPHQIQDHYRDHDAMLFPTLGDEWGLVVDESLASGLPVIGSCHSQAVQTIVHDGENGFRFDPEQSDSLMEALNRFLSLDGESRAHMRLQARRSAEDRTPRKSASQMVDAIIHAMQCRGKPVRIEVVDCPPTRESFS
jgi:glycosyltransferase involved in cell wall biosynthesis